MIISHNIHFVRGMTAGEVQYLPSCNTYYRKITILTKYNGQVEFTVFSEKADNLYFREKLEEPNKDPDEGFKTGIPK